MPMQLAIQHETTDARRPRLELARAISAKDIEGAQRLRYRVFVEEMGARIATRAPGRDVDFFDPWCEHLVVRDRATEEIVGTYRILTAERARGLGTFYADTEFDLTRVAALKPSFMELGRACIHPAYRTGATLLLLWQGIAQLMLERDHAYLIGCASVTMRDGGANALAIWRDVAPDHLAPAEHRVFPRHSLLAQHPSGAVSDPPAAEGPGPAQLPPLLKSYLRMGAWIGGEPAWDPDFNTADFFMLLPRARIAGRYARHYRAAA
jgi:putative hemolysin